MMHAIRQNPKLLIAGLVVFLVGAIYLTSLELVRTDSWQVRTVIHAEWPAEQLAVRRPFSIHGPQSFAIDIKGNLVVADPHTNAFITYSPDGTQKSTIKLKEAEAKVPGRIEVDSAGLIYGVGPDRKNVTRYNPDGSSMPVFSQAAGDLYYIEGLGLFGSGTLYVQDITFEKDKYTRRLSRITPGGQTAVLSSVEKSASGDGKSMEKAAIPVEVDDFVVARDGTLVIVSSTQDPLSRTITRISASGRIARFTIREQEVIRNCRLMGVDSNGNVYVAIVMGKDPKTEVIRYNSTGQRLSNVTLKAISTTDISGRVDPTGNFYITRTADTGYYIDKYILRTETKLVTKATARKK